MALLRCPLSLETPCTQSLMSDGNATKVIFTICPAFLGRHRGHILEGGRVDVSLKLVCVIFSTHPASKLHKSLANGHFQFSLKPREWFPCVLKKANAALFNLIITQKTMAKNQAHCFLCLKKKLKDHSKRFNFSFPEDKKSNIENGLSSRGAAHLLTL